MLLAVVDKLRPASAFCPRAHDETVRRRRRIETLLRASESLFPPYALLFNGVERLLDSGGTQCDEPIGASSFPQRHGNKRAGVCSTPAPCSRICTHSDRLVSTPASWTSVQLGVTGESDNGTKPIQKAVAYEVFGVQSRLRFFVPACASRQNYSKGE